MYKFYADNSHLSTNKGKNNVFIFGGIICDENAEEKIKKILSEVKNKYTYPTLPIKWNFKDLKNTYQEFKRLDEYNIMLENSYQWRKEIFEKSLDVDYKIILAITEKYSSSRDLKELKKKLININFAQVLMRVGLFVKNNCDKIELILDWPEDNNPKPFNREFFRAYNNGESTENIKYYCGPLMNLGFNESIYFSKSSHSPMLQFADLIIGSAKDFILKTINNHDNSLGYDLTKLILKKYNGYPKKIVDYGMNYSPKNHIYNDLVSEFEKIIN